MPETSITGGMSKSDALVQAHYFRALRIKGVHFSKLGVRYRGARSYLPNGHPYRAEGWAGLTACDNLAPQLNTKSTWDAATEAYAAAPDATPQERNLKADLLKDDGVLGVLKTSRLASMDRALSHLLDYMHIVKNTGTPTYLLLVTGLLMPSFV